MEREDAVEVVLRVYPWSKCLECKGMGVTGLCKVTETFEKGDDRRVYAMGQKLGTPQDPCLVCNSLGWVCNEEYVEACQILDKELPPVPSSAMKVAQTLGQGIREALNAKSITRQVFPPQQIPDDDD